MTTGDLEMLAVDVVLPSVVAEARLQRAVFLTFAELHAETLQVGRLETEALRIDTASSHPNRHPANITDVLDVLISVDALAYNSSRGTLSLTELGRRWVEEVTS